MAPLAEPEELAALRESNLDICRWFRFDHLRSPLMEVSRQFAMMAGWLLINTPMRPQREVALQKLLEAKDAAVRAELSR